MSSRLKPLWFLLPLVLFLSPHTARADAGTPLIWAGFFHLTFGNLLIGIGEGALLARCFSIPRGKAALAMIPSNYFSAWIGAFFLRSLLHRAFPMDLNNGWEWFWIMVLITYLITLLLEWPFVAWCFRGRPHWFWSSLRADLLVQSASYAVLFGMYWMASGTSLYTKMHIVPPGQLSLPSTIIVCYISNIDGDIYKQRLTGGTPSKAYELQSTNLNDRLLVRPDVTNTNSWDLVARLESQTYKDPRFVAVETNMQADAAPDYRSTITHPPQYENTWFNFGKVQRLRAVKDSPWEFSSGFWPAEGFLAVNKETGQRVAFSYETPFGAWIVRNAVQITPDTALFQLGEDQICAFDAATQKVALLWHGRGPVPFIPHPKISSAIPEGSITIP